MNKINDLNLLIDFELPAHHTAMLGHYPFMRWLLLRLVRGAYLELGLHWGETIKNLAHFSKANNLEFIFLGVDNFKGDGHSGLFNREVFNYCLGTQQEFTKKVQIIEAEFSDLIPKLDSNSFDLVLIDGFHRYENVKEEFYLIKNKVKSTGIVLFHDIHEKMNGFTTYNFWNEIKNEYASLEFEHSHGLGVLFMNDSDEVYKTLSSPEYKDIFDSFSIVGKLFHKVGNLQQLQLNHDLAHSKLGSLQVKNAQLSAQNQANLEILEGITSSNSWKLTRPLRELRNALRAKRV
jgi:hypothetical protein